MFTKHSFSVYKFSDNPQWNAAANKMAVTLFGDDWQQSASILYTGNGLRTREGGWAFRCDVGRDLSDGENFAVVSMFDDKEQDMPSGRASYIRYYENGAVECVKHYKSGKAHNGENGEAAITEFYPNGSVSCTERCVDGVACDSEYGEPYFVSYLETGEIESGSSAEGVRRNYLIADAAKERVAAARNKQLLTLVGKGNIVFGKNTGNNKHLGM